jgi:hypothetical protein
MVLSILLTGGGYLATNARWLDAVLVRNAARDMAMVGIEQNQALQIWDSSRVGRVTIV